MLKGIDPLLNADLLYVLQSMGHGDEIVICDANFPSAAVAADTVFGEVLRMDGADAPRAAKAILSVFPLDTYVDAPVSRMQVVGKPDEVPPLTAEVQVELDAAEGRHVTIAGIERFAFYEAARKTFAVVQTGEGRPYGNFILKKGVIARPAG